MLELSVVIAALNAERTLGEQLRALVAQGAQTRFEVLVADNGSSDGTRALAESFDGAGGVRVRAVDAADAAGAGHARNAGVALAGADRIAFCDADDVVGAGWVRAMTDALGEHAHVGGPLEYHRLNPRWAVAGRRFLPQEDGLRSIPGGPPWPYALSANLGVRRDVHDRIGGFDETLRVAGEDTDYGWRLARAGVPAQWVPDAVVHYRLRTRLRDLYRQGWSHNFPAVALYERYRDVWPQQPRVLGPGGRAARALVRATRVRSRADLAWYAFELGGEEGIATAARQARRAGASA